MSNQFLDALYADAGTDAGDNQDLTKIAGARANEILDDMIKAAEANGTDLSQYSHDDIAAAINQQLAAEAGEKTASAEGEAASPAAVAQPVEQNEALPSGVTKEAAAAQYFMGQCMAQGFLDALNGEEEGTEKVASANDFTEEEWAQLTAMNMHDILHAVGRLDKTAHAECISEVEGREKVASIAFDEATQDLLTEHTVQLLQDNGWPVDEIDAECLALIEGNDN